MALQLRGHCIIQTGWMDGWRKGEKMGSGNKRGTGRKDETRGGKAGMGVGLRMERFMDGNRVRGGRGRRWMYSTDGWL